MRARSILSEALRNLTSGTTRAALLTMIFSLLIGGLAAVDVAAVAGTAREVTHYRSAGSGVETLTADDGIDGVRCDALSNTAPIRGAGALRLGQPLHLAALPGSELTTWEVTPSLLALLPHIAQVDLSEASSGVWLTQDLADTLGVVPGDRLRTSEGDATVAAVFEWPDDGRARDLGYSVLAPVAPDSPFSRCWADIWPQSDTAASLLRLTLSSSVDPQGVSQAQLNPSLGRTLDARSLIEHRISRLAGALAALLGIFLGLGSVRLRRLEIASSLHAGVPKADLLWQHAVEAFGWTLPGLAICSALVACQSYLAPTGSRSALLFIGTSALLAGAAGTLIGVLAGVSMCRERHLFRLFKER